MAKKMKKIMAMFLVVCMMTSTFGMTVFAENSSADEFISDNGNDSLLQNGTSTITTVDENGNTVVATTETTTTQTEQNGTTVETTISFTTTTVTDENGNVVSESWSEDGVEKTEETNTTTGSLEIPATEGDSNSVVSGDAVGTETIVEGSEESGNYTKETVEQQGSITVETTDIEVKENFSYITTDMEHVSADVTPNENNDLNYVGQAPAEYLPGYKGELVKPENPNDYDYIYVGSGNTSKFVPAVAFDSPLTDEQKVEMYGDNAYIKIKSSTSYYVGWLTEEDRNNLAKDENGNYVTDEQGYILDKDGNRVLKEERTEIGPNGETIYLHRFDNYGKTMKVEGWFENGEWVKEMNGKDSYYAVWAGPQQFVLVDSEGNTITTYCADNATPTQDSFGYNVENLEDATYYSEEEAKQIRSIANAGYWGTEYGFGSLENMKQNLLATGEFTETELESLNDGLALTATQMAIWSYSNKMSGIKFVNSHYSNWGAGDVPEEKTDEVELMFKIYDYLINLEGTDVEMDTSETIINEDNFIKNMDLTVIKKDESHANNKDNDATNDAYVTNLTFALEVKPANNGEELLVKVLTADGRTYFGRIAGDLKDGETQLTADSKGNYSFTGITLIEGNQNFNITLEGIQNLKEGVYLYTSEVREGVSSQTLVGVSHGQRDINVTMNIAFNLNVDDEVVAVERVWHEEGVVTNDDPGVPWNIPARPLNNIPDEEVPLADAPQTGDEAIVFAVLTVLAGISLMAMHVSEKKRKEEV